MKIVNNPEFEKYTIWLLSGNADAYSVQVCSDL